MLVMNALAQLFVNTNAAMEKSREKSGGTRATNFPVGRTTDAAKETLACVMKTQETTTATVHVAEKRAAEEAQTEAVTAAEEATDVHFTADLQRLLR